MHFPARTIWDTRVQGVSGIVTAEDESGVEIYYSATFAQLCLDPPLIGINLNRLHHIEETVRTTKRFAINIVPLSAREVASQLLRIRTKGLRKENAVGIALLRDHHQIPYIDGMLKVLFCELQETVSTGDRRMFVARVIEARANPA